MVKKLINFGLKRLALLDEHTLEVLKKSSASTIVKIVGMGVGLLVSIFLGRSIGADGVGIINLSNRIVSILLVFVLLGFNGVIKKEIAIAYNKGNYNHIGNVMYTARLLIGGTSIFLSIVFIILSPWLANNVFNDTRLTYPLMIVLLTMTPQVLSRIFSSALVGYKKIWQSNLVEQTLSITITGILLTISYLANWNISILLVVIYYAVGRVTVTIIVGIYWEKLFKYNAPRKFIADKLLKTSLPLLVVSVSGFIISNADVVILGIFVDSKTIGIYVVAVQIALLTRFFLQVSNSAISPKIASLYENKQFKELEKMIQQVTIGLGIIGFFFFTITLFFGREILSIWGAEFSNGYHILLILTFGQMINISTGSLGPLLIMTGHEKEYMKVNLVFAVIFLITSIVFVRYFGIYGLAIIVSSTKILSNVAKSILVKKLININVVKILKS